MIQIDVWGRLEALPKQVAEDARLRAAVLLPLYEDEEGRVRIVIIKRPDHMPTHAGQLAFPGGMRQPEDADVVATALREAHEEVAIPPEDVEILGYLPTVRAARAELLVVPIVGRLPGRPALQPDPGEVESVLEPPLLGFLHEDDWRTEDWGGHTLWFFDIERDVLWGASAHMMRHLLELLRG